MKVLAGVLVMDHAGHILCGVRNIPHKPYFGYLSVPWGRAEEGEDPMETAQREGEEELDKQPFLLKPVSACAATGDGYRLYLYQAEPTGEGIDLNRHSAELAEMEWLTCEQIRCRGMVVPCFLEILNTFFPQ